MSATLVTAMPFLFRDEKPGVHPSFVEIEGVNDPRKEIRCHPIAPAVTYIYLDSERGHLAKPIQPEELAESYVADFIRHLMFTDFDVHPALFWVPGEQTEESVREDYPEKLTAALESQELWFKRMVEIADNEWIKNRHHRAISPIQKQAAELLGLKREWLVQSLVPEETIAPVKCPACRSLIDIEAAICAHCSCIVNPQKLKKLTFVNQPKVQEIGAPS